MSRPTRLKRLPLRLSGDENILETQTRRKINAVSDNKATRKDALNDATTKEHNAKGNLIAGKKILQHRQPVLRDRTNLPKETLNVDILVKKGTDDKTSTKTTMRRTAKSAAVKERDTSETQGLKKLQNNGKNPNTRDTAKKSKIIPGETEEKDDSLVIERENTPEAPVVKTVQRKTVTRVTKTLSSQDSEKNEETGKKKLLKKKSQENNENSPANDTDVENCDDIAEPVKTVVGKIDKRRIVSKILTSERSEKVSKNENKTEKNKNDDEKDSDESTEPVKTVKKIGKRTAVSKISQIKKSSGLKTTEKNKKDDSENSVDITERPTKVLTKPIAKRTASKILLTKQSEKSMENVKKKSLRRSSVLIKKGEKVELTGKKFFKSKAVATTETKLPSRKLPTKKRDNPNVSTSFRMRQTTLSESFAKHSTKKALRPREAQIDYRDQSTILENTAADNAPKAPIYKTAKNGNKSDEENGEIYEFQFDRNDSRERITKKRKKRVVKKNVVKKAKVVKSSNAKKIISKPVAVNIEAEVDQINEENNLPAEFDEPVNANLYPEIIVNVVKPQSNVEQKQPKAPEAKRAKVTFQTEKLPEVRLKPRIVESKVLNEDARVIVPSTPHLPKSGSEIRTQRQTNAFVIRPPNRYNAMLNHELLNKSISPICKAMEDFDPSSPWRPPTITSHVFSQINNIVQSTPQVRNGSTITEQKKLPEGKSQMLLAAKPRTIVQKKEEKIDRANIKPVTQKPEALAKSPRKFGTEISNVKVSNNPLGILRENNSKAPINRESPQKISPVNEFSSPRLSLSSMSVDYDDYVDKENSLSLSPKKSFKSPKKLVAKKSPLRVMNQLKTASKENWEPQPGPSGLQKPSRINQSRILQQSNLNNFLNIDELPRSTIISTAHGIFADVNSTPITAKSVKPSHKEANIDNAFGFDETDSLNIFVSPIKKDPVRVDAAKKIAAKKHHVNTDEKRDAPARFSIGDVKKHVRPILKKNDKISVETIENKDIRDTRENEIDTDHENDSSNDLTNVFDVDENEAPRENFEEIPLFADLEPVYFKQPPRHSYKRKRVLSFGVTEQEDEDDVSEAEHVIKKKKRKISKAEKQQQKRIEEWAKDLNNTFEEIEHFDLIVE